MPDIFAISNHHGMLMLMALVDPFGLDEALWRELRDGLGKAATSVKEGVVLAFTHDPSKYVRWLDAPAGFEGPVATIDRERYHLAVYASPGMAEPVRDRCVALGWHPRPERAAAADPAIRSNAATSTRVRGFSFLEKIDAGRLLTEIQLAADHLKHDLRATVFYQRRFQERFVDVAALLRNVDLSDCPTQAAKIVLLERELGFGPGLTRALNRLRLGGNSAVHHFTPVENKTAVEGFAYCHQLACWLAVQANVAPSGSFELVDVLEWTPKQQRREARREHKQETASRIIEEQKVDLRQKEEELRRLNELLRQRPAPRKDLTLVETVPDKTALKWVYFATPSKANRDTTYDLAYSHGVICSDVWTKTGGMRPLVQHLREGDLLLLAYGEAGSYSPQLYVRIEAPTAATIERTLVMQQLPPDLDGALERAGYSRDSKLGVFTGFQVTPCGDWKDLLPNQTVRKPTGQNYLRAWDEVSRFNGWDGGGE